MGRHLFADPQRLFADPDPGPDDVSFHDPNVDEKYYTTGGAGGQHQDEQRSESRRQRCQLDATEVLDEVQGLGERKRSAGVRPDEIGQLAERDVERHARQEARHHRV